MTLWKNNATDKTPMIMITNLGKVAARGSSIKERERYNAIVKPSKTSEMTNSFLNFTAPLVS
jgi:hypothetical protein